MEIRDEALYSATHEWVLQEGNRARVGVTDHAQHELGDVVYVELPPVGQAVQAGQSFGSIESVKAASELYSPVSGEVVEVNAALGDKPELVNQSAFDEGWMIVVELADEDELFGLLSPDAYRASIE